MASIARSPSINGHCPAYHGGTVAPNCRTRSISQYISPVVGFEARDVALWPHGNHVLVGHGGHGARHAVVSFDGHGIAEPPQFLAVARRKQRSASAEACAIVVQHEHAAVPHGRPRMAFAQLDRPEHRRARGQPLAGQGHARLGDAVEPAAAEPRPGAGQIAGTGASNFVSLPTSGLRSNCPSTAFGRSRPGTRASQRAHRPDVGPEHQRHNAGQSQNARKQGTGEQVFHGEVGQSRKAHGPIFSIPAPAPNVNPLTGHAAKAKWTSSSSRRSAMARLAAAGTRARAVSPAILAGLPPAAKRRRRIALIASAASA